MTTTSNDGAPSPHPLPAKPGEVLLLHNPNCSKSRATKAVLDQAGIAFTERLYMDQPLGADELAEVGKRLGMLAREWVRSGQGEYGEAGLDANSGDAAHFAAMAATPILMERPVVVTVDGARIGRPPIAVLELFGDE
ncbi:MAG: arsenate reductase [Planctomycetota bacterium]|jgi:arsenate reductase